MKGRARRNRNKMWKRYSNSYGWWVDRRTVKRSEEVEANRFERVADESPDEREARRHTDLVHAMSVVVISEGQRKELRRKLRKTR